MSDVKTECIACGGGTGQRFPCVCAIGRRLDMTDAQIDAIARKELYGDVDWALESNLYVTAAPRAYFRVGFRAALRAVRGDFNGG